MAKTKIIETPIRQAQTKYLRYLHGRVKEYEARAVAELNKLNDAFNDTAMYIKEDLGVPLNEVWGINDTFTAFTKEAPVEEVEEAKENVPEAPWGAGNANL